MAVSRPTIGITADNKDNCASSGQYEISIAYSRAVAKAGGLPVMLPHEPDLADYFADMCQGLVLTGGVDPRTENFGHPTHPRARPLDARRQAFELALLETCRPRPRKAVLGICLGMQLMALHAGGRLDQYLPQTLADAHIHQGNNLHTVEFEEHDSVVCPAIDGEHAPFNTSFDVVSHHQQAVADPGRLRTVAKSYDGVIEAIDDPSRPFYAAVQWHPERGDKPSPVNQDLFDRLVRTAAAATSG